MITRSKLVEQLRDYQIRSQHKCPALTVFSPRPHLSTWSDVVVAVFFAVVFFVLVLSSYLTLYFRHFWLSLVIICLGIFLPIRLRMSRQALTRKRERRLLLPLSM
ncbi:NADH-ubiquinone oxidoreductase chain [Quillaja saponaria]|uniref:NADH-ubiquinone oxidoreductase chain n=1 Tax=Quillaja saponaria TaxID=32244 RepID=A0AAD7L962_QUISA|nr:NADH-ubiquinone oxidoreductase chain [Quillaja saponaria]